MQGLKVEWTSFAYETSRFSFHRCVSMQLQQSPDSPQQSLRAPALLQGFSEFQIWQRCHHEMFRLLTWLMKCCAAHWATSSCGHRDIILYSPSRAVTEHAFLLFALLATNTRLQQGVVHQVCLTRVTGFLFYFLSKVLIQPILDIT